MQRIKSIRPEEAKGKAKEQFDAIQKKLGTIPNIFKAMAQSPTGLDFYLAGSQTLSNGTLDGQLREQISLVVSQINGCNYCLAAHSAIGKSLGLSDETIQDARLAQSPDTKTQAILTFAQLLLKQHGKISDQSFEQLRNAGVTDAEIGEIIANVAFNVFTTFFNISMQTQVDFPAAPKIEQEIA